MRHCCRGDIEDSDLPKIHTWYILSQRVYLVLHSGVLQLLLDDGLSDLFMRSLATVIDARANLLHLVTVVSAR